MRFIRRCLAAASYVLVSLGSAQAVAIGETGVLSATNGNVLLAKSKLSKAATVESLSFYVSAAGGKPARSADVVRRLAPPG
jgi:hypothetical protein